MTETSHLYLIEFSHALKVGISCKPEQRLKQHQGILQTFGLDGTIKRSWVGIKCYNAVAIERAVVRKFAPNGREWLVANFDEVLTFILGHTFKLELTSEEIAAKAAVVEDLQRLLMPPVPLRDQPIPVWASSEMLDIQNALTEQAFCLLSNNYLCMGLTPPADELDMFFGKMSDVAFRMNMMAEYHAFEIDTRSRNDCSMPRSEVAGYFMESFLKERGFTPYTPFWTSGMSPEETKVFTASSKGGLH